MIAEPLSKLRRPVPFVLERRELPGVGEVLVELPRVIPQLRISFLALGIACPLVGIGVLLLGVSSRSLMFWQAILLIVSPAFIWWLDSVVVRRARATAVACGDRDRGVRVLAVGKGGAASVSAEAAAEVCWVEECPLSVTTPGLSIIWRGHAAILHVADAEVILACQPSEALLAEALTGVPLLLRGLRREPGEPREMEGDRRLL